MEQVTGLIMVKRTICNELKEWAKLIQNPTEDATSKSKQQNSLSVLWHESPGAAKEPTETPPTSTHQHRIRKRGWVTDYNHDEKLSPYVW